MEYEVWHDEYKGNDLVNEYWHSLLFIPISSKEIILQNLKKIRNEHSISIDRDAKFAGCLTQKSNSRFQFNNLQLLSHSLLVKDIEPTKLINLAGRKRYEKDFAHFLELNGVWGCRYFLMKIPDNHKSLDKYPMTYAERVETTFRFALRAGLHYLFTDSVKITGFIFDGYEHHTRKIDRDRISKGEFRENISLAENFYIDDRQRKDRNDDTKILMSLIDTAAGAFSAKVEGRDDPYQTLFPLNEIFRRAKSGALNVNRNGRWYRSISMSQMLVENEDLVFRDIFIHPAQGSLFVL